MHTSQGDIRPPGLKGQHAQKSSVCLLAPWKCESVRLPGSLFRNSWSVVRIGLVRFVARWHSSKILRRTTSRRPPPRTHKPWEDTRSSGVSAVGSAHVPSGRTTQERYSLCPRPKQKNHQTEEDAALHHISYGETLRHLDLVASCQRSVLPGYPIRSETAGGFLSSHRQGSSG
jgi:hypothetical protein